jgi:hypothetical protein
MPRKVKSGRTTMQVTLPTFTVLVLRQRASDRHLSVSAVVDESILDGVMLDEVERMAKASPDFARIAKEWMRSASDPRRRPR